MSHSLLKLRTLVSRATTAIASVLSNAAHVLSQMWLAHVRRMRTDAVYRRIVSESLLVIAAEVSPSRLVTAILAALIGLYVASYSGSDPHGSDEQWPVDGLWD